MLAGGRKGRVVGAERRVSLPREQLYTTKRPRIIPPFEFN
jgi:hypothetical protein